MAPVETLVLKAEADEAIPTALATLESSGLVAFPTDTVYGLGAQMESAPAVKNLYLVKGRPREKPIPVLIGDESQLALVSSHCPPELEKLTGRFWPGPLTIVVPKADWVPQAVSPGPTVAIRVPDHAFAQRLLEATGPLAVTSANPSGAGICRTAAEVEDLLGGRIDLIIDGGATPGEIASTVVAWGDEGLQLLRLGPISRQELEAGLVE